MSADMLTILAPDRREHGEAICDLAGKCFSSGGRPAGSRRAPRRFRDCCRQGYLIGSHYDWAASRVGLVGDRLVTHWGVWSYTMRIGTARLRAGGIGTVATDADFRKRGLMLRTARASLAAMRNLGYDLSFLFGLDDFYWRLGYVRAWPSTTYTVAVADLPADRPAGRVLRFIPVARRDITAIYNRENDRQTGTAVRPTYPRCVYPRPMQGFRWADARGRTKGYVVLMPHEGRLECVEAGGNVEQALRVVAARARRAGLAEVQFFSFSDACPILNRLRQGNCRAETRYRRSGAAMVTVVNLASTLGKMAGELERRLRASPLADWRGSLLLDSGREQAVLVIDRGRVRVAAEGRGGRPQHGIRGGEHVAQLLIGTDAPGEVIEAAGMKVAGDARRLAEVLFPAQHPQLSLRDMF
jgi:hypothetical protein